MGLDLEWIWEVHGTIFGMCFYASDTWKKSGARSEPKWGQRNLPKGNLRKVKEGSNNFREPEKAIFNLIVKEQRHGRKINL